MKKLFKISHSIWFAGVLLAALSIGSCSDPVVDETLPDSSSELTAEPRAVGLTGPTTAKAFLDNVYVVDSPYGVYADYSVTWSVTPTAGIYLTTVNGKTAARINFLSAGTYNVTATAYNRKTGAFAASGTLAVTVTTLPSATVTGPDLAHVGPFNPDVRPYIYTLTNYLSSNYSYDWKIVTVNAQPGMSHANANVLKVSDFDDVGINRVIVTVKSGGIPIAVGVKNVEVRWTGY